VTKIGELGTTQAATSNRRTLRRNTKFLQESHGATTQKTPFFILNILFLCAYHENKTSIGIAPKSFENKICCLYLMRILETINVFNIEECDYYNYHSFENYAVFSLLLKRNLCGDWILVPS
jgi:hypothetical protein